MATDSGLAGSVWVVDLIFCVILNRYTYTELSITDDRYLGVGIGTWRFWCGSGKSKLKRW